MTSIAVERPQSTTLWSRCIAPRRPALHLPEEARRREERAEEAARLREAARAIEEELGRAAGAGADAARRPAGAAEAGGAPHSIPWGHLAVRQQIGRGSFKTVYVGELRGTRVALLMVPGGTGLEDEVMLMARLGNSPNIAVCYGLAQEPAAAARALGRDCLVMEYAPHGALIERLEALDEATWPARTLLSIAAQVAQGMASVAAAGIVHRDLAARNVLVFSVNPPHVKVTDFGLSRLSVDRQSVLGTHAGVLPVRWAPPEAISGRRRWVLELSDVWSLGVLLWELFTRGFVPYDMLQSDDAVAAHVCGGGRLEQPAECPDAVYEVMRACWEPRPQDRPTFAVLTSWLQGVARGESARPEPLPPEERAGRECVICLSEPRVSVAEPCRHCCMCEACSQVVRDCPLCRQHIERRVVLAVPPNHTFVGR